MKKVISLFLSLIILITSVFSSAIVFAADRAPQENLQTLDVHGYTDYSKAFDCLTYINKYREENNIDPLVMDKTLLEIAMARAAETAVYAAHSKPDGSSIDPIPGQTLILNGKEYPYEYYVRSKNNNYTGNNPGQLSGENLAIGIDTVEGAAVGWYNSQGHRNTFMKSTYKSTGVGFFWYGDCGYAIQVFASFNADEEVTKEDYPLQPILSTYLVDADYIQPRMSLSTDIMDVEYANEQYSADTAYWQGEQDRLVLSIVDAAKGYRHGAIIDPSKVTYSSSDSSKVSVDKNGIFTVKSDENTKVTLYCEYQNKKYPIDITLRCNNSEYTDNNDNCSHKWNNGTVDIEPDCYYNGQKIYTCQKCGDIYIEDIKSTGHKYKTTTTKATTSKNGTIKTKCTVCGYVKNSKIIYYPKTVTLSTTAYTYNGKVRKPTVTIKDSKGNKISSENYTISYPKGRKNVGTYNVTIKFKGNYSGTVKRVFTIKPKTTNISKLTKGKKKFTVKWKKRTTQTSGYQIQYATNSKFTKNKKTVTVSKNKTTSKTISKLKAKKKYYIRVRTYKTVNGKKIYSSWSKAKTIVTKK